ncbi:MAG: hypothetical protein K8R23_08495 [Chthoniobacter sp.]|nr:hypothetical protein [Chthoniobacter sp.]
MKKWAETAGTEPLFYQGDARLFVRSLEHGALLWRYTAFFGGLFHMNRSMWSRLPWSGEFPLYVSSLRPRIVIRPSPVGGSGIIVNVALLPEIAYEFNLIPNPPSSMDLRRMRRQLRTRLRGGNVTARFVYSTTPMSFGGWEQVIRPDFDAQIPESVGRMPSVLVPRHFVSSDDMSATALRAFVLLSKRTQEGVSRGTSMVDGEPEPCLIFHVPCLLAGIRNACEKNSYGDRIYELEQRLVFHANGLKDGGKDYPLKPMTVAQLHNFHPSYWCLDPATNDAEAPDDWRRKVLAANQRNAETKNRWQDLTRPTASLPDGSSERTFRDVLRDLDADFLYCHLLPEDRAAVERLAELWAEQVQALIGPLYDVNISEGKGRVIAAVEADLREQAAARKSELMGWVYDALVVFAYKSRRIIRKTIETMQRCSLVGVEPVALVVESESSLLKRWNIFLRESLKSQLIPRKQPPRMKKPPNSGKNAKIGFEDTEDQLAAADQDESTYYEAGFHGFDEPVAQNPIAVKIVALIETLLKCPQDLNAAQNFAIAAVDIDGQTWRAVLACLAKREDGAKVKAAVMYGLDICRNPEPSEDSDNAKISALMKRFSKLTGRKN